MKKEYFKIALIFFVTVAAVVFGLYWLYGGSASQSTKATGETMTLTFDPASKTTTNNNEDFTVTFKIKPSVDVVLRGYMLNFPFDKEKLTVKSIDYKLGAASVDLADTTAKVTEINQKGKVKIVGEVTTATGTTVAAANPTDLIAITFTSPTSTSAATISIDDEMTRFFAIKSDTALFNVPLAATAQFLINGGGPTVTPGGPTVTGGASGNAKLKLKLKFQGIAGKPADALNKIAVRIKLLNEANEAITDYKSANFTADANGIWSGEVNFNVAAAARYVVYVKGDMHIQKKVCDEKPTETAGGTYRCDRGKITLNAGDNNLDFSGILMLAGDLPTQDGSVTAYDTSLVRNNLGKSDAEAISKSDVNHDGIVNTQDYSLIIAALSVRNDE